MAIRNETYWKTNWFHIVHPPMRKTIILWFFRTSQIFKNHCCFIGFRPNNQIPKTNERQANGIPPISRDFFESSFRSLFNKIYTPCAGNAPAFDISICVSHQYLPPKLVFAYEISIFSRSPGGGRKTPKAEKPMVSNWAVGQFALIWKWILMGRLITFSFVFT